MNPQKRSAPAILRVVVVLFAASAIIGYAVFAQRQANPPALASGTKSAKVLDDVRVQELSPEQAVMFSSSKSSILVLPTSPSPGGPSITLSGADSAPRERKVMAFGSKSISQPIFSTRPASERTVLAPGSKSMDALLLTKPEQLIPPEGVEFEGFINYGKPMTPAEPKTSEKPRVIAPSSKVQVNIFTPKVLEGGKPPVSDEKKPTVPNAPAAPSPPPVKPVQAPAQTK
jgi:hypothetical protein